MSDPPRLLITWSGKKPKTGLRHLHTIVQVPQPWAQTNIDRQTDKHTQQNENGDDDE